MSQSLYCCVNYFEPFLRLAPSSYALRCSLSGVERKVRLSKTERRSGSFVERSPGAAKLLRSFTNLLKATGSYPPLGLLVDGFPRGEVVWEHPPRRACAYDPP